MTDNITLPREVVKLALEALEWSWGGEPMGTLEREAITALRTALAAEQTKPVAVFDEQMGHPVLLLGSPMLKDKQPLYTAPPEDAALRRDAERYRWLRNRACHGPHERFVTEYGWFDVSGQHEPGFDAAIDAAMENKR